MPFYFFRQSNGTTTFDGTETTADLNPSSANAVTVTAKWTANIVGIHTISTMQAMTSSICSASTKPDASATTLDSTGAYHGNTSYVPSTTLTDSRDSKTYTIRRLADGKCWMTQNLRLVGSRTLMSSDSNVSSSFTLPAASTSWSNTYTAAKVYDTGNTSYGVYYNYYAASAGTISGSSNTTEASYSVCPKGWRFPTHAEQSSLLSAYSLTSDAASSTKARSAPISLVYSGYYDWYWKVKDQGSSGHWWSSTYNAGFDSAVGRHDIYLKSDSVSTNTTGGFSRRDSGNSIRCVAQQIYLATQRIEKPRFRTYSHCEVTQPESLLMYVVKVVPPEVDGEVLLDHQSARLIRSLMVP